MGPALALEIMPFPTAKSRRTLIEKVIGPCHMVSKQLALSRSDEIEGKMALGFGERRRRLLGLLLRHLAGSVGLRLFVGHLVQCLTDLDSGRFGLAPLPKDTGRATDDQHDRKRDQPRHHRAPPYPTHRPLPAPPW